MQETMYKYNTMYNDFARFGGGKGFHRVGGNGLFWGCQRV